VRDDDARAGNALQWLRGSDHDVNNELGKMKLEVNENRDLNIIGMIMLTLGTSFEYTGCYISICHLRKSCSLSVTGKSSRKKLALLEM